MAGAYSPLVLKTIREATALRPERIGPMAEGHHRDFRVCRKSLPLTDFENHGHGLIAAPRAKFSCTLKEGSWADSADMCPIVSLVSRPSFWYSPYDLLDYGRTQLFAPIFR